MNARPIEPILSLTTTVVCGYSEDIWSIWDADRVCAECSSGVQLLTLFRTGEIYIRLCMNNQSTTGYSIYIISDKIIS